MVSHGLSKWLPLVRAVTQIKVTITSYSLNILCYKKNATSILASGDWPIWLFWGRYR